MSGCQRLAIRRRASWTARWSNGASSSSSSSACSTSRIRGMTPSTLATSAQRRSSDRRVTLRAAPWLQQIGVNWPAAQRLADLGWPPMTANAPLTARSARRRWSSVAGLVAGARRRRLLVAADRARPRRFDVGAPAAAVGAASIVLGPPGSGAARRRDRVRRSRGPEQRHRRRVGRNLLAAPRQLRRARRLHVPDRHRDGRPAVHDAAADHAGASARRSPTSATSGSAAARSTGCRG